MRLDVGVRAVVGLGSGLFLCLDVACASGARGSLSDWNDSKPSVYHILVVESESQLKLQTWMAVIDKDHDNVVDKEEVSG